MHEKPNVLLVTVEGLRADRVGFAGDDGGRTPHMVSLARRGVTFLNAYAPAPDAVPSVASIHTGLYPAGHGIRTARSTGIPDQTPTLAEAFKAQGYRTAAFAASVNLHTKYGIDRGFDVYAVAFDDLTRLTNQPELGVPARRVVDRVLEHLESVRTAPFFIWVNFQDPRYPYMPPEPFATQFSDSPYDGEVAYVDAQIGRVLAKLEDYGISSQTRVLLAGTTGEGLGDHGELYHGTTLQGATTRVPLVLVAPGPDAGGRVETPVSLVDVAPTLLHAAGVPPLTDVDGVSLLSLPSSTGRPIYLVAWMPAQLFGWEPLVGVVEGRWKLVSGTRRELFDLSADAKESADVSSSNPQVLERLSRLAAAYSERFRPPPAAAAVPLLAELGYSIDAASRERRDPRDMVSVANDALKAERAAKRRQLQAAANLFEDVLKRDPTNYLGLLDSALLARSRSDFEGERRLLERAQALYPLTGEIYHRLSHLPSDEADSASARRRTALLEAAVQLDPKNEEALYDLACAYAKGGRADPALDLLERSVREGFRDFAWMAKDSDLDGVRSDPRFERITGGKARAPEPVASAPAGS